MGYRLLEHTADLAIEAWGATPEEALAEAARALFAELCDLKRVQETTTVTFEARGGDDVECAVHLLQEALAAWNLDRLLLRRFRVERCEGRRVRAVAWGEPFDPGRHEVRCEMKAVTYHQAAFGPGKGGWRVRFIVDL